MVPHYACQVISIDRLKCAHLDTATFPLPLPQRPILTQLTQLLQPRREYAKPVRDATFIFVTVMLQSFGVNFINFRTGRGLL